MIFLKECFSALDRLNFAYLVYINSFQDKNKYSFLDYNLDNKILSQGIKNLDKLNLFNNLILAANGNHALYVHNRNSIGILKKITLNLYYDGEFNIKEPKNLNFLK